MKNTRLMSREVVRYTIVECQRHFSYFLHMGGPPKIHLAVCFVFCFLPTLSARQHTVSFSHITLADGLSQSSVKSIVQDHKGFVWFGTEDGLNRYDGYTFTVYRHKIKDSLSLAHNYISALYYSRKTNTLWVGTQNGVLHSFDEVYETFTRHNDKGGDQQTRGIEAIQSLTEDGEGNIWIRSNYLYKYHPSTKRFMLLSGSRNTDSTVHSEFYARLFTDRSGDVWVGAFQGAYYYRLREKKFGWMPFPAGSNNDRGDAFLEDAHRRMLVGTNSGLLTFDTLTRKFVALHIPTRHFPEGRTSRLGVFSLALDSSGVVWGGTTEGVVRIEDIHKNGELFGPDPKDPKSLSERNCLSLLVDRGGVLFVGTYGGVSTFAPWRSKFKTISTRADNEKSLSMNNVRSFCEDGSGNIWVGTMKGLNRLGKSTGAFSRYYETKQSKKHVNNNVIWSLYSDAKKRPFYVYMGSSGGGINRIEMDGNSQRIRHVETALDGMSVFSLLKDSAGILFAGTIGNGVIGLDEKLNIVAQYKHNPQDSSTLSNSTVISLCEDANGILWAGSDNGLNRIDRKTGKVRRYFYRADESNSPSGNNILSICREPSGVLWFGTYSGLNRFDPISETFSRVSMEEGLPNDVIYAILRDKKENLWLSTNKGIVRYTPATKAIKWYTPSEGVQGNEFNQRSAFVSRGGEMYFGGVNGYNVFYPDSVSDNPHVPEVALTDFKLFNKSIRPSNDEKRLRTNISNAREILLDHQDAVLTFEFVAMDYTSPGKNQYAYRMEGFNNDWSYAGTKREATYTNLNPGTYTFRVKASNNDGVWNEEGMSIAVIVAPPWWMTWWFRTILVVTFLSVGPIIYYRRVTGLKKDYALQQEFSRRLIESQESERKRIASELHDSIGQDLLVIKNRTYMANQVRPLNAKVKQQLDHIAETVTQSLQNVRQVARNLRPYHLDRVGLTGAIKSMLENVAQSSLIGFDIQVDTIDGLFARQAAGGPADGGKEMEVNVYRIVQESVNNILKHSEANHAAVEITKSDGHLSIAIQDDGKGFDPSTVHAPQSKAGLGLSGMGERVRMLGGIYKVHSTPGGGTRVSVSIPIPQKKS